MMPKQEHELTSREAADLLGVHIDTVKRWAKEALASHGTVATHIEQVRVEYTRKVPRYYFDRSEIESLLHRDLSDNL